MSEIDEDDGFCPRCHSSDTVLIRAKAKRACLTCEFSEEFESVALAIRTWQIKSPIPPKPVPSVKEKVIEKPIDAARTMTESKQVDKFIEVIELEITKITIPTRYREDFNQYLKNRNIALVCPYKTDTWNNVESAYTVFELAVKRQVAEAIFDDWVARPD